MPDGPTPIYKMVDSKDQENVPDGFTKQDEILLRNGPENWLTYTIDCYQLYLGFLGWKQKELMLKPDQVQFVKEVMKTPGVFVIDNWRYNLENRGNPQVHKHLIAKMFVGIRYKSKLSMIDENHRRFYK